MIFLASNIGRRITAIVGSFTGSWSQFWFQPAKPFTLAAVRICTGFSMLCLYASCMPEALSYIGPEAWVDQIAMQQIRFQPQSESLVTVVQEPWYGWSIWYYIVDARFVYLTYYFFVAAIVCFTFGLFSRTMNLLVWLGHLSFIHRSVVLSYGVDNILAMLLLYQLVGPTVLVFLSIHICLSYEDEGGLLTLGRP